MDSIDRSLWTIEAVAQKGENLETKSSLEDLWRENYPGHNSSPIVPPLGLSRHDGSPDISTRFIRPNGGQKQKMHRDGDLPKPRRTLNRQFNPDDWRASTENLQDKGIQLKWRARTKLNPVYPKYAGCNFLSTLQQSSLADERSASVALPKYELLDETVVRTDLRTITRNTGQKYGTVFFRVVSRDAKGGQGGEEASSVAYKINLSPLEERYPSDTSSVINAGLIRRRRWRRQKRIMPSDKNSDGPRLAVKPNIISYLHAKHIRTLTNLVPLGAGLWHALWRSNSSPRLT
ncbi:hypothetical protein GWI33_010407 [Rhynchophorus ferrugineus]|uniref:Uncharacterized protein n=1 Tax=Rhynchophorus ferrugineus TaxID=354439 RepID=A0A834IR26_RHYFE|nr:hypothetical protein GWI33_010407 [Rhynchophorus ferrugineus]